MERIKKRLRRNNFLAGSLLIAFLLALSVAAARSACANAGRGETGGRAP
jgi:hypothetical protein